MMKSMAQDICQVRRKTAMETHQEEENLHGNRQTMEQTEESIRYYKEAYEREREKRAVLIAKLADAESRAADLEQKLERIKGSVFWKLSKPLRSAVHFMQRTKDRISRYGNIRGIARKLDAKRIEKLAKSQHGTASFPTPEEAAKQRETKFSKTIKISILVPLYNTPKEFLVQAVDSVLAQTYENWELCLADGSDADHAYVGTLCEEYVRKDAAYVNEHPALQALVQTGSRIIYRKLEKNGGISENTNRCLEMATGDYIGLFDHDDILHPAVLYEYMKAICERGADYIYCDESTFHGNSIDNMITLHFKPNFAIDNLRANNYICHFSVFDRKLLEGTEVFRSRFDGSQDHDMILRLTANAKNVVHIPKLMYYWRSHKGSVASDINAKSYAIEAAKGAVADHLQSLGFQNFEITSTKAFETIFRIRYEIEGNPKISIVIPNKDHYDDLKRCVTSILEKSSYDNYEIIIVENNSTSKEIFDYYDKLREHSFIRVIEYQGEFNYSRINNLGVSKAVGEYVILLNNDTQVITLNWMEELLMYAQRDDVGAAGAKLYYADKTIQHAGVVIGLGAHRTAGHTHYRVNYNNLGYMGRLCYTQNVTAVTGACLMVKKEIYDKLGGLDESFAVSLNDVDFCLRIREAGYLNVFTPFAELYHFESISRGADDTGEKAARYNAESERFRQKWQNALAEGDPYYNPNFSLDRSDFALKINQ